MYFNNTHHQYPLTVIISFKNQHECHDSVKPRFRIRPSHGSRQTKHSIFSLCREFCFVFMVFVWHEASWNLRDSPSFNSQVSRKCPTEMRKAGMFAWHLSLRPAHFFPLNMFICYNTTFPWKC